MSWISWPFRLLALALWFVKEIVVSNVAVVWDNLTPGQNSTPGLARFVTRCRTDAEITLLASMITLTPGTLTVGTTIDDDDDERPGAKILFVHAMYSPDADHLREELLDMESRMLRAFRRRGDQS
ncbi:Na+/H+ antiporter subunit E [Arthrobacter sp. H20]|uniref:Na+/H+ antiporter subunit E n=1 Tax=Arthrobacter sp. H20 TaxID=1267981 RepID=UPI00047BE090|nr:Na+/H+ antiporter subunit E [Arthrobacter sp. H20]